MEDIQHIKQRFGIIGNNDKLNRSISKAVRVAPTDISVLVTGESGTGKESIPKIIHALSHRKHKKYIAVNCGAIPEGTIDSELFGHEKGAFTGATQTRSGYFEVADGGTIFLDEVGELPLTTQVRLLRVLENGEYMKVGSSKVQKTDVRIVAATNLNMPEAIQKGKFREDLFYRLSTIEIELPPLRDRQGDIHLLFRKFASDFAQKYNMPTVRLTEGAILLLQNYPYKGNIRQLRNITEQLSVIEKNRTISALTLQEYLPNHLTNLPSVIGQDKSQMDFANEREIFYKIMLDMRSDINDLKKLTLDLMKNNGEVHENNEHLIRRIYDDIENTSPIKSEKSEVEIISVNQTETFQNTYEDTEIIEPSFSLQDKEEEMIKSSLERNKGKRKLAAKELGISERTLYRKIKQYDL
ncbi:MAG TPA: sigma-54-dependent Fis family transcriptional regulator [Crocinitomix sp.]|nr:sigma-54-dependent Fis family transcriptional regulator [Crocinitomix sp.]